MKDFNQTIEQLEADRQQLNEEIKERRLSGGEIQGRQEQQTRLAEEAYENHDNELSAQIDQVRGQIDELSKPVAAIDPLLSLSTEDLSRAASLKAFLSDDMELPVQQLKSRVDAAIEAGDRVVMSVYSRLLGNSSGHGHKALKSYLDQVLIPKSAQDEPKIAALREKWSKLAQERTEARQKYTRFVGKDNGIKVTF